MHTEIRYLRFTHSLSLYSIVTMFRRIILFIRIQCGFERRTKREIVGKFIATDSEGGVGELVYTI